MKRITFLKSLLLAALLSVGGNAWADNVYMIVYGVPTYASDGVTITAVAPQTDFTTADGNIASDVTSSDGNGSNCTNAMPIGGSVLYSQQSFTRSFETAATKGIVHFEANYTSTTANGQTWQILDSTGKEIFGTSDAGKNNGNGNQSWGFSNNVSLGTNWYRLARSAHHRVVLDINLTSKKVSYTVLASSGNNSYSTLTGSYDLPEGVADVKSFKANRQSSGSYTSYMDNVSFYNVYDDAVTEAAYTINYQFNGTTVASEAGSGVVGSTVDALSTIWNDANTQKYFVTDGATTSFTIADGTNEFNVAVREAEVWTYYVKAFEGSTELMTISTNTVVEGETASYGYPQYINVGGVLYKAAAQSSNPWWGESYTMTENNSTRGFQYAKEGNGSIVFCSEAEDIEGLAVVTGGNTDIRASNRKGAYASTETKITTLEPGIYRVFGATYGNAGTTFTLKAGDATVFTVITDGNPKHTTGDYFLITENTDLVMPAAGNGGNSPKVMDYIIIQKAGEYYESMSIVGDFSANAWDAANGIAMTRTADNPFEWTAVVMDYTVYSSDMWYEYKAVANENWTDYVLGNPNATNTDKNQEYNFDYDGAGEGIYTLTFTLNTQSHTLELSVEKQPTATVYFVNTDNWDASNVKIWVWDENNSDYNYTGGTWPGQAMTATGEQIDGKDVYSWSTYELNPTPTTLIISNNGSETERTGNQAFVNGATYRLNASATISATLGTNGYATFAAPYALDLANLPEGLKAYKAAVNGTTVNFTEVTEAVEANTGLLLGGTASETYSIPVASAGNDISSTNAFLVNANGTTFDAVSGYTYYGLLKNTLTFATFDPAAVAIPASKAYLKVANANAARLTISFDDDNTTTGISNVNVNLNDDKVYNLNGQRVNNPKKGLFIVNGKKFINK